MIAVSVFPVEHPWQGGLRMSSHPPSHEGRVSPVQVWPALSLDLRTRVIGLLAQLALNMVAARPGNEGTRKEVSHADPTSVPENPS
jgi:hypothetical protein